MNYSDEEKKVLKNYFSNVDDDVFCLINLPEVIKGTLFSRYSRSAKDLRRLFLDEFLNSDELKNYFQKTKEEKDSLLRTEKAEDFYKRILVGYGDDSVAELGGAHLALENISVLATKSIEEHRIGLSPLEKSSRYVYFDKKVDGRYQFYTPKKISSSKYAALYEKVNNLLFDTYSKIVHEIQPLLMEIYPGDKNDIAYKFSIRAKACDLARYLLPLSAKTNLGIFGNGRAFEYLLINLYVDPLEEVVDLAKKINEELRKVIPAFIKRASNERGLKYQDYLKKREEKVKKLLEKIISQQTKSSFTKKDSVKIVDYEKNGLEKVLSAIIFEKSNLDYQTIYEKVKKMSLKKKEEIFKAYVFGRENRHHKVGRALENVYFTFEVMADFGVYKDLMRHRILTRYRQLFTNEFYYAVPKEIDFLGFDKIYRQAADFAVEAYLKIKEKYPFEAQYLVLHGAYNRFYMKMNLREVVHLCELRSSPQGHPSYRKIAQEIAKAVIKKYPIFKIALPFVDYNDYSLERLSSFKKLAEKAKKLKVNVFLE
jgi:Predicted alternative thymidylate synthase